MAQEVTVPPAGLRKIAVSHKTDVAQACRIAREVSTDLGFDQSSSEEIALACTELASNLLRHAGGGVIEIDRHTEGPRFAIKLQSVDEGPGIAEIARAMRDGFSTAGGLGYGLGTVNRLMDTVEIMPRSPFEKGTRILCLRWHRSHGEHSRACPIECGAATHPRPGNTANGDAFVIHKTGTLVLIGVIDGLGHGPEASIAAAAAREYIERHAHLPLAEIFRGTTHACSSTRGVVMSLVQYDWATALLTFAGIGNVEIRVSGAAAPTNFVIRRGIVGVNAPNPVVTQHPWNADHILALYSDGVKSTWQWDDIPNLSRISAQSLAGELLRRFTRMDDDATVVVMRGRP